jgi:6-phosphogluconolactonase
MTSIRIVAAVVLGAAAFVPRCPAAERLVWFGTYTNPKTKSEGIYVSRFDDERGTLTEPVLAGAATNPSFLALHPRLPVLYAVSEGALADGKPGGAVEAFAIAGATGALAPRGAQSIGGTGPCHVAVDAAGLFVFVAAYGSGGTACLSLANDGTLEPIATGGYLQHVWDRAGTAGIDPRRQDKPHAHSVDVTPDGFFVIACDLGLDEVLVHRLDRRRATLTTHSTATVKPGAGPRHLALHPDGRRAWCVNELDLTVTGFVIELSPGTLTVAETVSTLPDTVADRTGFSGAEIAVHPQGRFVYASIRGLDSIATFRIVGDTPTLEFLGTEPARVKTPRHFAIDPTGRFLLAAGQGSDTITVFTIDPETGRLTFTDRSIKVPAPVCILFDRNG